MSLEVVRAAARALAADAADVVLSRACAACDRPGSVLCEECRRALIAAPGHRPAIRPLWFGADYGGVVRAAVLAHKEEGMRALSDPLADLLVAAVHGALAQTAGPSTAWAPVLLVPIPPHRTSLRRRGRDTVAETAQAAARRMPRTRVAHLLRRVRETDRQAGRGASARQDTAGAFAVGARWREGARAGAPPLVVLVDDVVTTGATVSEGARALAAGGIAVTAIACIASTPLHAG